MNKKILFGIILVIFLVGILPGLKAEGEVNFCCEKTVDGAWCQNAPEDECDTTGNLRAVPTSCEATGFCKLGCCYDSQEGTCMENTPQIVCNENGGVWDGDSAECEIAQCDLGCCLMEDQAAFVTQTRCKRLSSLYGLETNFRRDITDELECIATATSDVKGACVFDKDFERTCKLTTQKECKELSGASDDGEVSFHEGYLCSAPVLATNCGASTKTTCVEGEDEVYFLDTCGNLANIYDANKIDSDEYWSKIYSKGESCNPDSSNANSGICGNCDYYLGSTCKQYERGEDRVRPAQGDYLCRDLGCEYEGETYPHGATWCATNSEISNSPGSEYFRLVCYNGEVTVEPCAAFRSEICVESNIEGFPTAACRVNRWKDCVAQNEEKDCLNTDKRDCEWVESGEIVDEKKGFICVPENPPGFDFWNAEEKETGEICGLASTECTAKFEKGLLEKSWKCVENCQCCVNGEDEDGNKYEGCSGKDYEETKDAFCGSLGDCGKKTNFVGVKGYNFYDDTLVCNGKDCYWEV